MLYYEHLDELVFNRTNYVKCDEIDIISGYVGPDPIQKLAQKGIKSTVVYGMFGSEGIKDALHNTLKEIDSNSESLSIMYSTIPVHSKCYVWKYKGEIQQSLVGSANFSINGLTTPMREMLAETSLDSFPTIDKYLSLVLQNSISCVCADEYASKIQTASSLYGEVCEAPLYSIKNGIPIIPGKSGLNWGMARYSGSHVNVNDAYIPISKAMVSNYPSLFPIKQKAPTNKEGVARLDHRHNDNIEIIWDDGTYMTGLLEGTREATIAGKTVYYPKQISTTPSKSELGEYLRNRLHVPLGKPITMQILKLYGRDSISISMQAEGVYYFDFHV